MLRKKTELEQKLLDLGYKMLSKHYSQKNTELTEKYTYKKIDKEWYVELNPKRDLIVDYYIKLDNNTTTIRNSNYDEITAEFWKLCFDLSNFVESREPKYE